MDIIKIYSDGLNVSHEHGLNAVYRAGYSAGGAEAGPAMNDEELKEHVAAVEQELNSAQAIIQQKDEEINGYVQVVKEKNDEIEALKSQIAALQAPAQN